MQSLERAIVDFVDRGPEFQRAAAARASQVRTMDEHFAELFAHYRALRPARDKLPAHGSSSFDIPALAASARHQAAN